MLAPTLVTTRTSLPLEGAGLALGFPALAAVAAVASTLVTAPNGCLGEGEAADANWQSQIRGSCMNDQAFTSYLQ